MKGVRLKSGRPVFILALSVLFSFFAWGAKAAEPTFDQTARYILEIVKEFRTAYVLEVVEHLREGGVVPQEDWQKDAHYVPLPAQFVKAAADQVTGFEMGLIGLTPLNPENRPRTIAESDALLQLEKNRDLRVLTFVDGDQFKAISADLAIVQSCVDCHNNHARAPRRNFRRWDVMGGIVVRLKRDASPEGLPLGPEAPKRPVGPIERLTPNPTVPPPWVR
jgi:hypothetical protein